MIERYRPREADKVFRGFRGDAAFAIPDLYELLEAEGYRYAIRLKANPILEREIEPLLKRPVGRPSKKPRVRYHHFQYQAKSWEKPRRVVSKVTWHQDGLFPQAGFIVTNRAGSPQQVPHFYNQRGTAEHPRRWIKQGKHAIRWTRLSCTSFDANQVRLQLHALAYNNFRGPGNFLRRIALPGKIKHWSLTTLRVKPIKTGTRMVCHARYVTFQMAEVAVPRGLYRAMLRRIAAFSVRSGPT